MRSLIDDGVHYTYLAPIITHLSAPTKELKGFIKNEQLEHFNNPVMRWMISNTYVYSDPNENIRIVKNRSKNKIDGVAALVNAIAEYMTFKDETSIYEERDFVVL